VLHRPNVTAIEPPACSAVLFMRLNIRVHPEYWT
jgi:hypothetical protein